MKYFIPACDPKTIKIGPNEKVISDVMGRVMFFRQYTTNKKDAVGCFEEMKASYAEDIAECTKIVEKLQKKQKRLAKLLDEKDEDLERENEDLEKMKETLLFLEKSKIYEFEVVGIKQTLIGPVK